MRRFAALLAAVLGVPVTAAEPVLGVGPFSLGMGLDEMRAAAPGLAWRDTLVSPRTGRVFGRITEKPVALDGVDFLVEAQVLHYQRGLRLHGAVTAADAPACERQGLAWLARLEARIGPLQGRAPRVVPPGPSRLSWTVQRGPRGITGVTPSLASGSPGRTEGELLSFGNASTALAEAFDDAYRSRPREQWLRGAPTFLTLSSFQRSERHEALASVEYDPLAPQRCRLELQLRSWTAPPPPEAFDARRAKLLHQATQAERHLLLASAKEPLTTPRRVTLRCGVQRATGWLHDCQAADAEGLRWLDKQIALSLARLMVFDIPEGDPDDPQDLQTQLDVTLDPADLKPIDFLDAPRTPLEAVVFSRTPSDEELAQALPFYMPVPTVQVELVCRIQADGSLVCAGARAMPEAHTARVSATAYRVAASLYRAEARLRDGRASAGQVIALTLPLGAL